MGRVGTPLLSSSMISMFLMQTSREFEHSTRAGISPLNFTLTRIQEDPQARVPSKLSAVP